MPEIILVAKVGPEFHKLHPLFISCFGIIIIAP
jgi:hypothetical protein